MPKYNYGYTDRPTHEDSFHITQYIDGLASFIQRCNTPITISIQGDWGTGKTRMMEMVYDKIKNNEHITQVKFNTWQFSQFNLGDVSVFEPGIVF